jgi:hypothetical protein
MAEGGWFSIRVELLSGSGDEIHPHWATNGGIEEVLAERCANRLLPGIRAAAIHV